MTHPLLPTLLLALVATACSPSPVKASVYDLQQGRVPKETWVRVENAIVTGTGLAGFWVQEEQGGPYSGLWVEMDMLWQSTYPDVVRGARVDVTGLLLEFDYYGMWPDTVTEVSAKQGQIEVRGSAPEPEPATVTFAELMEPATSEPWEGVVIRFSGDFELESTEAGFGAWSVRSGPHHLLLQDSMVPIPQGAKPGDRFCGFSGIWQYSFGEFKVEPRNPEDLCRP